MGLPADTPAPPDTPDSDLPSERRWITRRRFLAATLGVAAAAGASAVYASQVEPWWIRHHDLDMPLANLPPSFAGLRIVHLTDLHASEYVPDAYLRKVVETVNARGADLVVITGDLVTSSPDYIKPLVRTLSRLDAPLFVTLGNHDYWHDGHARIDSLLVQQLTDIGAAVLRNQAHAVEHDDGRLWLVGLEDWMRGPFDAVAAFANVPDDEPAIALSHNPDSAPILDQTPAQWILAGHTHGGQVRIPLLGPVYVPVINKQWNAGQYALAQSTLYVSRGVGSLYPFRLFCRPEAPRFILSAVAR